MAYSETFRSDEYGEGPSQKASKRPRGGPASPDRTDATYKLTGSDLADIVRLIERKLAWYGFTSVKVGPYIRIRGTKIFIDLLERDTVLCRLELDPAMQTSACSESHGGLATLMNSLRGEAPRGAASA